MLMSFEKYYRLVTGNPPFGWQSRLADEIDAGTWPPAMGLPTAAGKTSLVEIWVYALARDLVRGVRRTPLRLVWVIDRRIVVDEVANRAQALAAKLHTAEASPTHPLYEVAATLRQLGGSAPLAVAQLRGGMAGQRRWTHAPNQPVVLATTVDQAGSRLLFRGYGVSPHQYSLEAGLLGCDTLIVVDEAHLSQPFVATLDAVRRHHTMAEQQVSPASQVVVVSATLPSGSGTQQFTLTPGERTDLAPRVARPKVATLIPARSDTPIARNMAGAASHLIDSTGAGVTAVIVNRVDTAREIFSLLAPTHDAILLTGRIRPHDRDALLATWLPHLRAGRPRETGAAPRVVVATQTVEVGADFDFDALVTEVAPFSALRQRFGRLNRLGARAEAAAVIVERGKEDGVYPYDIVQQVWAWLNAHAHAAERGRPRTIDLSDEAITQLLAQHDAPPDMTPTCAPILTRMHVDLWSQTSPVPTPDPDIAPFLHGMEKPAPAEVQVVWRADLVEADLARALASTDMQEPMEQRLSALLDLAPPGVEEAISLPVWVVRRWLAGARIAVPIADVEVASTLDDEHAQAAAHTRYALRWDGRDAALVDPSQITPGDTIVLPATYGGLDAFGWDPHCEEPVRDVGDLAGRSGRRRQRLRLHPLLLPSLLKRGEGPLPWVEALQALLDELNIEHHLDFDAAHDTFDERLAQYVDATLLHTAPDAHEALLGWQASDRQWIPYPVDESTPGAPPAGVVLEWIAWTAAASPHTPTSDPIEDGADESSMVGIGRAHTARPVTLADHSAAVAACARAWAEASGFPPQIIQALEWAGRFHDLGKCEPRFQVLLHGGDEAAAAAAPEPLAKSGIDPHDRVLQDRAHRLARVPARMRHEAISAQMLVNGYDRLPTDLDRDLVCYLVGAHHGRGRPWFPVVKDTNPTVVNATMSGYTFSARSTVELGRIDAGWPDRFATLQRRYSAWGLAYIESMLRLADHWVSSQEALR